MGIYVQDRDRMDRFYTEVLGLVVTNQGESRTIATKGRRASHPVAAIAAGIKSRIPEVIGLGRAGAFSEQTSWQ